jgi:3-oxoacyl-[acyl-carrier protein] reductase
MEEGREVVLAACLNPDIPINNADGPPPSDLRQVTRQDWIRAVDANMLTPIFLIRALAKWLREAWARTSGVKSPGIYLQLGISIGVRSGLIGFAGALCRQVARRNSTINGLLPGRFETDWLRENLQFAARAAGHGTDDEALRMRSLIPAGRFGTGEEFGAFAEFLCSTRAWQLRSQNIILDDGAYPGLL